MDWLDGLGWYLFADFLIIGAFRIYAPQCLSYRNIIFYLFQVLFFGYSLIGRSDLKFLA